MRQVHSPVWLGPVARAGGPAFIVLFTLDTLARAILVTVLPLQAYDLLGDVQKVSLLYLAASIAGLAGSLAVPWLVSNIQRRWALTLGALSFVGAAPLLAQHSLPALLPGIALHMFGAACSSICLNLYVLDHVPRQAYTRFEPTRMLFSGAGWMVGPVLGIYLETRVAGWLPYTASAIFALGLLGYFWFLRATESPAVPKGAGPPPNPVLFVRRYFSQPRLVLAWLLAMGRAGWWGMFFMYAPIYAVTTGLGEEAGGLISSAGSAFLFIVTFWGWVGRRLGLRWLLVVGFAVTAVLTVAVGLAANTPWLGAGLLIATAGGASIIDGAGNVPFMRAVRSWERAEMTTVFATYRDAARLSTPAIYALILQVFALPAVFVASGVIMLANAWLARYVPGRMGQEARWRSSLYGSGSD